MKQLEKIYLANIVLYFDHVTTAEKFTLINKKCKDALQILHINPCYQVQKENEYFITKECNYLQQKMFLKEISLFPHLETIRFTDQTIQFLPLIPHHIQLLQFQTIPSHSPILTNENYYTKIVSMTLKHPPNEIDLSQFIRLKQLTLVINETLKVKSFITQYNQRFDVVRIKMEGFLDEEFLSKSESYNIQQLIVEVDKKKLLKKVVLNKRFWSKRNIIYCYKHCLNDNDVEDININENEIILHTMDYNEFVVSKKGYNQNFLMMYYPYHVKLHGFTNDSNDNSSNEKNDNENKILQFHPYNFITNFKATNCFIEYTIPQQVTRLELKNYDLIFSSKLPMNSLKSLSQLKELHLQGKITQQIELPTQLTALTINDFKNISNYSHLQRLSISFAIDQSLEECTQLTYLSLSCPSYQSNQSLSSLHSLKILYLNTPLNEVDKEKFYPSQLQSLHCHSSSLPSHLNISELNLSNLLRSSTLSQYTQLQRLRIMGRISSEISFPQSLTSLTISCFGITHKTFSWKYLETIQLKELHIENCLSNTIELPSNLETLYFHYSHCIISNKIKVKKLMLNESIISLDSIDKDSIMEFYSNDGKSDGFVNIDLYYQIKEMKRKLNDLNDLFICNDISDD